MATVVPTLLATDLEDYDRRLARLAPFAPRIHIDIADGDFAPSKTIDLLDIHVPQGVVIDFHLMTQHPERQLDLIVGHRPGLVIWHHEARADQQIMHEGLSRARIRKGIGILPGTSVDIVDVSAFDHALVFTGQLGFNGGVMDTTQLHKIGELKGAKPSIEVSVDGGVNLEMGRLAVQTGVDLLYSGNYISGADDPRATYNEFCTLMS